MEIIYKVGDKEFTSKTEAQKYENSLMLSNAKFKEGDTVYFVLSKSGLLGSAVVENAEMSNFGKISYKLKNLPGNKYEESLYGSLDEYIEYVKTNIAIY